MESGVQEPWHEGIPEGTLFWRCSATFSAIKKSDWVLRSESGVWQGWFASALRDWEQELLFINHNAPWALWLHFLLEVKLKKATIKWYPSTWKPWSASAVGRGRSHHVLGQCDWGQLFCSFRSFPLLLMRRDLVPRHVNHLLLTFKRKKV